MTTTFFIKTYGCQMNERDSEAAAALLVSRGYRQASSEKDADILLVNTCSVRGKAEDKALGKLGLLTATKQDLPGRKVGVLGCMVQRMKEEVFRKVRGLDFAVGTHRMACLPDVIERVLQTGQPVLEAGEEGHDETALGGHLVTGKTTSAFVNILFGCNRHCAYCVVPTVRGPEWSRPAVSVLDEVRKLAAAGVREVTLLGQSVMSYGAANPVWLDGTASPRGFREPLPRLLEAVNDIEGIHRVRFTSGHPSGCTEELARAMAELPAVCEHLHLPLQSGSDRILGRMRRGYTMDGYRRAADRLRRAVPAIAFTTDIIVGFPSETEAEFEMTRAAMEEIQFDNSFIFKYSPRPGTPSADWADDVPETEKARRNRILLEDQDRRAQEINNRRVGTVIEVLAEGVSLRNGRRWAGRSRTHMTVVFEPAADPHPGDRVNVRVERATPQTLYGVLVS